MTAAQTVQALAQMPISAVLAFGHPLSDAVASIKPTLIERSVNLFAWLATW